MEIIEELGEKIEILYCELEQLNLRENVPNTDSSFQEDLNKVEIGLKLCSNAI